MLLKHLGCLNTIPRTLQPCRHIAQNTSWTVPCDKPTHTGQQWDTTDKRLVRFVDVPKQVNSNWAVKMIAQVPPTKTKKRVVWCDGGVGALGHPRVYINLDKPGNHSCLYCGLRFTKEDHH